MRTNDYFFNEPSNKKQFSLWVKKPLPLNSVKISSTFECSVLKQTNSENEYKKRYIVLNEDKLYYSHRSTSNTTSGFMNLKMIYFSYTTEMYKQRVVYSVNFFKNKKYVKFLIKKKSKFDDLLEAVKPHVIQTNFYDVYSAKKLIG